MEMFKEHRLEQQLSFLFYPMEKAILQPPNAGHNDNGHCNMPSTAAV
jgi:hypothetical protein